MIGMAHHQRRNGSAGLPTRMPDVGVTMNNSVSLLPAVALDI